MSAALCPRVSRVIAETLGVEPDRVVAEARLGEDLGADSLEEVELALCLEDEFGFEIDPAAIVASTTVGEVDALMARLRGTA